MGRVSCCRIYASRRVVPGPNRRRTAAAAAIQSRRPQDLVPDRQPGHPHQGHPTRPSGLGSSAAVTDPPAEPIMVQPPPPITLSCPQVVGERRKRISELPRRFRRRQRQP